MKGIPVGEKKPLIPEEIRGLDYIAISRMGGDITRGCYIALSMVFSKHWWNMSHIWGYGSVWMTALNSLSNKGYSRHGF